VVEVVLEEAYWYGSGFHDLSAQKNAMDLGMIHDQMTDHTYHPLLYHKLIKVI
jgi:hypothetical protein